MKRFLTLAAALLLGFGMALPTGAQAQNTLQIGPRVGLPIGDLSDASTLFFGADARYHSEDLPVVPNASFDYYLTDVEGTSYFAVDLNALYEFGVDNQQFTPYAGGGIGITRSSFEFQSEFVSGSGSDTEIGLNLVGGARFPMGSVEPFAQLNATLGGNATRLGIAGGLLFSL